MIEEEQEVEFSYFCDDSGSTTHSILDPIAVKLDQMREHFESIRGQMSDFQFELEYYKAYRVIENDRTGLHKETCVCRRAQIMNSPLYLTPLNSELDIISQRTNILEVEMYADLIVKCCAFSSIMKE